MTLSRKLKEHLQQLGFIWIYSHEDLLPRDLSQQKVLVMSWIPTLNQMSKTDKEVDTKKAIEENKRIACERKNLIRIDNVEESSSSSSISMYSIDFD